MVEELKVRIHDYKKVEDNLKRLGAKFSEEINVIDTYFNPPKGEVLKITEDDKGEDPKILSVPVSDPRFDGFHNIIDVHQHRLKEIQEFFETYKRLEPHKFVKFKAWKNAEELKKELTQKFGVKCVLKKKRRFWYLEDFMININLIEDVGEFLIVECENPTPEIITEKLGIKNPEFITVSFDELKR